MAEPNRTNGEGSKPRTSYPSLDRMTEEFNAYLEESSITDRLLHVFKSLYEMEEKPADPLDYMRLHMTEVIPEREELIKLQEEFDNVRQQIAKLEQENAELEKNLSAPVEVKNEDDVLSSTSENAVENRTTDNEK